MFESVGLSNITFALTGLILFIRKFNSIMQNGSSLLCWLRREYRPQYEALRLVESTTPTDDEEPSESIFYLRKRLERLQKIIVYLKAGLVLISVASVLVFSYSTCAPERIGIDPNGLVPPSTYLIR